MYIIIIIFYSCPWTTRYWIICKCWYIIK